jgi:hypothetical protein
MQVLVKINIPAPRWMSSEVSKRHRASVKSDGGVYLRMLAALPGCAATLWQVAHARSSQVRKNSPRRTPI